MADASIRVPPGHQVTVYSASTEPGVARSGGGVVLASFGWAGDDPDPELAAILTSVGDTDRVDAIPTLLVSASAPITVSDLFAPAEPAIRRLASPVVWIFHQGSAASLVAAPQRVDLLLARMRELRSRQVVQTVCIVDRPSRSVARFVERVRDLGVEIRRPDLQDGAHVVLVEVTRLDGRVLSALAGTPEPIPTADAGDEPLVPLRSPHLGRLVRDHHARGSSDISEIAAALRVRTLPLLMMVDPATHGVAPRSYGNTVALPVFSDLPSLQRAAREMGMATGSYGIAMIDARALFAMAESQRVAVALCAYRGDVPLYAVLTSL